MVNLYRPSGRHEVKKLSELLDNYINYNSKFAEAKLSNMILDGEDLVESMRLLEFDIESSYTRLIEDIRKVVDQKEGSIADKLRSILDEHS